MNELDWGMIGAMATIVGVLVAIFIPIIQSKNVKKQEKTNKEQEKIKQNVQSVKGLFVVNNEIKQENK